MFSISLPCSVTVRYQQEGGISEKNTGEMVHGTGGALYGRLARARDTRPRGGSRCGGAAQCRRPFTFKLLEEQSLKLICGLSLFNFSPCQTQAFTLLLCKERQNLHLKKPKSGAVIHFLRELTHHCCFLLCECRLQSCAANRTNRGPDRCDFCFLVLTSVQLYLF